jgi:hypothetical protein
MNNLSNRESYETENAIITGTKIAVGEIPTFWVFLSGNGWNLGYGGFIVNRCAGGNRYWPAFEAIQGIIEAVGGSEWESLKGKAVRVKRDHNDIIIAIGHLIKDEWFSLQEFIEMWTESPREFTFVGSKERKGDT